MDFMATIELLEKWHSVSETWRFLLLGIDVPGFSKNGEILVSVGDKLEQLKRVPHKRGGPFEECLEAGCMPDMEVDAVARVRELGGSFENLAIRSLFNQANPLEIV